MVLSTIHIKNTLLTRKQPQIPSKSSYKFMFSTNLNILHIEETTLTNTEIWLSSEKFQILWSTSSKVFLWLPDQRRKIIGTSGLKSDFLTIFSSPFINIRLSHLGGLCKKKNYLVRRWKVNEKLKCKIRNVLLWKRERRFSMEVLTFFPFIKCTKYTLHSTSFWQDKRAINLIQNIDIFHENGETGISSFTLNILSLQ